MENRIDEYIKLLRAFYDDKFLFNGVKGNYEGTLSRNGSILKLNKPWRINETIIKYRRAPGEGCTSCEEIFEDHSKIKFYDRLMEFPGFHESLDFEKEHVKDIMILGEAAGPGISTHVNCTYGLSNTDIIEEKHADEEGKIDTERIFNLLKEHSSDIGKSLDLLNVEIKKKTYNLKGKPLDEQIEKFRENLHNNLWERLVKILPDSLTLKDLKNKVYVTDLVKCNAKGNEMWKHFKEKCFESFLIHEIRIINPKLIIFLGNTGYDYLKNKFEFEECCPTDDICTLKNPSKCSKYEIYNFRDDKHIKSYYDKYKKKEKFDHKSLSEFEDEEREKLIKKLPRYFPTFGTVNFIYGSTSTPIKFIKIFHNSKKTDSLWNNYSEAYKDFINDLVEDKIITF